MAKEKLCPVEVADDIFNITQKRILGVYDIMRFLKIGYNKAKKYLDGKKEISVYDFARKLI